MTIRIRTAPLVPVVLGCRGDPRPLAHTCSAGVQPLRDPSFQPRNDVRVEGGRPREPRVLLHHRFIAGFIHRPGPQQLQEGDNPVFLLPSARLLRLLGHRPDPV